MKTLFVFVTLTLAALSFSQEAFAYTCRTSCNQWTNTCDTTCW
jgi:hypothetical protein